MAPRGRRTEAAEPEAFHEFGVRGRKTGVFLPDRGERDEHGMQPLESIFSSPRKSTAQAISDDSESEDMDIASSAGPGPRTLLKGRTSNIQYPIPRSRSPVKTNLRSPARRNPHLDRLSSPTQRGAAEDATVTRKLDFAGPRSAGRGRANGTNGVAQVEEEDESEDDMGPAAGDDDPDLMDMLEESIQMVNAMDEGDDNEELDGDEDDEPIVKQTSATKGRGRPKKVQAPEPEDSEEEQEEPPVKRRGRPPMVPRKQESQPKPSNKRRSSGRSTGDEDEHVEGESSDDARDPKRQRTEEPAPQKAAAPAKRGRGRPSLNGKTTKAESAKAKPKPKGRPARVQAAETEDDAGETSFMALQRGPPMPRSRGLVSVRRDDVNQTRSGRHSYRPVDYWRGEDVVVDREEQDNNYGDFLLPTIKEVVRVPEDTLPSKRAPRSKTRAKAKAGSVSGRSKAQVVEEDEELEEWEVNPGTQQGEVVLWEPEHEIYPPAEDEPVTITEEQIAISADAVQTRDIRDATFRFAKTLTMPFMGAGVVDLPPGAEKRPKNSRKMHMVFFVHYGKVIVTVNEAQFRISAGGMWFVPRGNYYSITNDYDNPARIFFSQACEVAPQMEATEHSLVA